jgi:GNAT superfamily N-acetyltransferase
MVAEQDGQIVGFVSGGPERSGDSLYSGEVYAIYILPAHQRKGIGRLLIREAVQALLAQGFSNMLIWVLSDNPSRTFYEALGGEFVREQPIQIGAQTLTEAAYGWIGITPLGR